MAATKTAKTVQVIATYYHKRDGKLTGVVSHLVKSSDGKSQYCTTLIDGKASGCSCKARGNKCYHRVQLEAKASDRKEIAASFKAASVPTWMVQLVEKGQIVTPTHDDLPTQTVVSAEVEEVEVEQKAAVVEADRELAEMALEAEVSAMMAQPVTRISNYRSRWATRIVSKNTQKGEIKAEMSEIKARREAELRGNLNGNRAFAIMR